MTLNFNLEAKKDAKRRAEYLGACSCLKLGSCASSIIISPNSFTGEKIADLAPIMICGELSLIILFHILNLSVSFKPE